MNYPHSAGKKKKRLQGLLFPLHSKKSKIPKFITVIYKRTDLEVNGVYSSEGCCMSRTSCCGHRSFGSQTVFDIMKNPQLNLFPFAINYDANNDNYHKQLENN